MGDTIDLYPANGEYAYRFEFGFDTLEDVKIVDPLTFDVREKPDYIHILKGKKIIKTGDYKLSEEIEKYGFKDMSDNNE